MDGELVLERDWELQIERVQLTSVAVVIFIGSAASSACCPDCGGCSSRIHSRYPRTLQDLPAHGRSVQLKLQIRRFFCDQSTCPRRTFAERLEPVTRPHARKTSRLIEALRHMGFALGGEAAGRLSRRLAMSVSGDRILRYVRNAPLPPAGPVRVVGVDDWAWRKRDHYGTIVCDLQTHRPVDLLPERSSELWADWLQRHPGVQIISRDRGGCYALGAQAGAPEAVQVADRFHLLTNCRTALVRLANRFGKEIRAAWQATQPAPASQPPEPTAPADVASASSLSPPPEITPPAAPDNPKRARRLARYNRVMELHAQGLGYRTIAKRTGIGRNTVQRFLHAGHFPERAKPYHPGRASKFAGQIRDRWDAGCHSAIQIFHELQQEGFDGSYDMIRRWIRPWRTLAEAVHKPGKKPLKCVEAPAERTPSHNQVSWLLVQEPQDRDEREQRFLDHLQQQCPQIAHAATLADQFHRLVKQRRADQLDAFLAAAAAAEAPQEMVGFAQSLKQDYTAVRAALELEWSNGQTEGQVNRLKLIKRQMYGRAGFELLRQRVLQAE